MTVIMRDAIKPNLLQTLENTPGARARRSLRQHRPRQLLGGGRPDRHPRRRVPHHRGRVRRRHGCGALLQHQVPHVGPGARRCRRGHDGAGDEAALGAAPRGGRSPAAARHARGEPRGGAARRGQPPGPPGHRAPPRGDAGRRHQRHRGRLPLRARRHPGDRGVGRGARRGVHALRARAARARWSWPRRSSRPPRSRVGSACSTTTRRRLRAEDRDGRHRGVRCRRGRLPARGREPARHTTSGPASAPCPSASPRPTSPSRRTPHWWAPRGWRLPVREARANVGAGFVYLVSGDMRTMPGLSQQPRCRDGSTSTSTATSSACIEQDPGRRPWPSTSPSPPSTRRSVPGCGPSSRTRCSRGSRGSTTRRG